ncbi:MAG: imidazole glycerol phosphate synthase subunit HisH [Opitutales bacterium]
MSSNPPDLAIIDYGMSNLRSVLKAWEYVGGQVRLVHQPAEIGAADALIFPGQGAIVDTMKLLKQTGFDAALTNWIAADKPFFGICLGLQALFEHSEEGDTPGLGIFRGQVQRFRLERMYKVPHMGWNAVSFRTTLPGMLEGIASGEDQFYFVHSYHAVPEDADIVWGETTYGYPFCSAVRRGRCVATQFHPEKSQAKGLQIYRNFLSVNFPGVAQNSPAFVS